MKKQNLSQYLRMRSREICKDNGCFDQHCPKCKQVVNAPNYQNMCKCFACHLAFEAEETEHRCESYAYINANMQLMDICAPDFFQGSSKPFAAISLPWNGNMRDLKAEVADQCAELEEI